MKFYFKISIFSIDYCTAFPKELIKNELNIKLTPLVPALRKQRQADLFDKFKVSLVYIASSKRPRAI